MMRRRIDQLIEKLSKRRGPESPPLLAHWRRIYVLPSMPGLFFSLMWLVMLMAALNFNNNMGLLLVFLLLGLAQVTLFRTFYNFKNLRVQSIHAEPVFCGEMSLFKLILNSSEDKFNICIDSVPRKIIDCSDCLAAQGGELQLSRETTERGWVAVGVIKLYTRYPLGIFTVWSVFNSDARALVYPTPEHPLPAMPLQGESGAAHTARDKGDDLSAFKPYQPGDPVRDIAWKKSAQMDQTLLKDFHRPQGSELHFDLNCTGLSNLEDQLSRLSGWIGQAHQKGLTYRLTLPGFTAAADSTHSHYLQCMKALALYRIDEIN